MDYFPLYANLKQRPVLVVGAGEVAFRKIELLRQAGAQVRVIAAKVGAAVQQLLEQNQVQWLKAHFEPSDVEQAVLTIAATDDAQLNQAVHDACVQRHRLVNVVDNPALCTFIVPAIVDRSPVQIAISTGGTAPVLARQLRQKIEQALPPVLAPMATLAGQYRSRVKAVLTQATARRSFWEKLFADPIFTEALSAQRAQHAEQRLQQLLHTQVDTTLIGHVTLVGAGPGDSGLLTLAGFQALQAADVVLYDALVGKDVLAFIRRDAQRIAVGKRAHAHQVDQATTNQLLIQYAQQGLRVVRLKGGDPFVFGRGAEELEALKAAGVSYRVVPGITAALGATAYAGIPLTHRLYAQAALFITGHCRAEGDDIDWSCLARQRQTLVIYMGTLKATEISTQLIAHGKASTTPVAIISQGTLAEQQVQVGTLATLPALAQQAERPTLIVVGEVVQLQASLQWFA